MTSRRVAVLIVLAILVEAFCVPLNRRAKRHPQDDVAELHTGGADVELNAIFGSESTTTAASPVTNSGVKVSEVINDEDDDDFDEPMQVAPTGGGSNIFSLLRLAGALFPGSSGANDIIRNMIRDLFRDLRPTVDFQRQFLRRKDVGDNEIDYSLKPPLLKLEIEDDESDSDDDNDSDGESDSESNDDSVDETADDPDETADDPDDTNNAAEESAESDNSDKQDSESDDDDSESDYDDGGDGQGGGVLGILAGLSGGEGGESDLGSLLATVSGIVASLSGGPDFDLNAILASGVGLFVGLLSQDEEDPGTVLSSYLLTSLDGITGGGAKNNGAFFGKFLSNLIKGTSAGGDPDASSEEDENKMPPMADSAGFLTSFLMGLLGDMSKGSSHPWSR